MRTPSILGISRRGGQCNVLSVDILADAIEVRGPLGRHARIVETWG